MMNKLSYFLLISATLFSPYLFAHKTLDKSQTLLLSEPKQALKLIQSVHYSSLTTEEQLHYTHLYVSSNNLLGHYIESKRWIEQYKLPDLTDSKSTNELFDYAIRAAWAYEATQDYPQAMKWYQQAEEYGKSLGDRDKQGYVYLQYSAVESLLGNQYQALKLANEAYVLLTNSDDEAMVADLHSQLGIMYYLNGDYRHAIQFQEKVLKQAIKDNSTQEIAVAHYNLANAYFKWAKVEHSTANTQSATFHYQEALGLAQKIGAKYLERNNRLGLISLYSFLNAVSNASAQVQQLLERQFEYSGYSELSYHLVLAEFYRVTGDRTNLLAHLNGATLYYEQAGAALPAYALDKQNELSNLYFSIGQYKQAYRWLDSYAQHAIGRYKSETQQKVKELQSEIENQRLAIENRDLNHQMRIRFWLISAIVVVLILSIGLLYQQRKKKQQLYHLSNTDFLTGLANRRRIFEWGEEQFSLLRLSSVILDIDHFKMLNDTHGHEFGDAVLKQVSSIVRTHARQEDMVGRIGGEEFLILLPKASKEQLVKITENIRSHIAGHSFSTPNNEPLSVTASFGIAEHQDRSLFELVNLADSALYQAKRTGRNRCVLAD